MSSKQTAVGEIKRILFIPRRMVRRGVERVETVPFRFNIGSIGQGETHATENCDSAIKHLREWMERSALQRRPRQRNVKLGKRCAFFFGPEFLSPMFHGNGAVVPSCDDEVGTTWLDSD